MSTQLLVKGLVVHTLNETQETLAVAGHLLRTPRERLISQVFHSGAQPQPPYKKGSLQELCPWPLNEAETETKDQ